MLNKDKAHLVWCAFLLVSAAVGWFFTSTQSLIDLDHR
jgi:hypothetical protein